MNSERKEPHLSGLDHAGSQERIPTLSERAAPDLFDDWLVEPASDQDLQGQDATQRHADLTAALDDDEGAAGPSLDDYDFIDELTHEEPRANPAETPVARPEAVPEISAADIEVLSDRVLDRIAPALREAISAAVTELLADRSRETDRPG